MEYGLHPAAPPGPPDWLWVMSFPCANPGPGPGGQRWPLPPAPPPPSRARLRLCSRLSLPGSPQVLPPSHRCRYQRSETEGAADELHRLHVVFCVLHRGFVINLVRWKLEINFLLQAQAKWRILRGLFNQILNYS